MQTKSDQQKGVPKETDQQSLFYKSELAVATSTNAAPQNQHLKSKKEERTEEVDDIQSLSALQKESVKLKNSDEKEAEKIVFFGNQTDTKPHNNDQSAAEVAVEDRPNSATHIDDYVVEFQDIDEPLRADGIHQLGQAGDDDDQDSQTNFEGKSRNSDSNNSNNSNVDEDEEEARSETDANKSGDNISIDDVSNLSGADDQISMHSSEQAINDADADRDAGQNNQSAYRFHQTAGEHLHVQDQGDLMTANQKRVEEDSEENQNMKHNKGQAEADLNSYHPKRQTGTLFQPNLADDQFKKNSTEATSNRDDSLSNMIPKATTSQHYKQAKTTNQQSYTTSRVKESYSDPLVINSNSENQKTTHQTSSQNVVQQNSNIQQKVQPSADQIQKEAHQVQQQPVIADQKPVQKSRSNHNSNQHQFQQIQHPKPSAMLDEDNLFTAQFRRFASKVDNYVPPPNAGSQAQLASVNSRQNLDSNSSGNNNDDLDDEMEENRDYEDPNASVSFDQFEQKELKQAFNGWYLFKKNRFQYAPVRRYIFAVDQDYKRNKVTVCAHFQNIYNSFVVKRGRPNVHMDNFLDIEKIYAKMQNGQKSNENGTAGQSNTKDASKTLYKQTTIGLFGDETKDKGLKEANLLLTKSPSTHHIPETSRAKNTKRAYANFDKDLAVRMFGYRICFRKKEMKRGAPEPQASQTHKPLNKFVNEIVGELAASYVQIPKYSTRQRILAPASDSEDSDSNDKNTFEQRCKKANLDDSPSILPSQYDDDSPINSNTFKLNSKSPLLPENQAKGRQRKGEKVTLKNKNGEKQSFYKRGRILNWHVSPLERPSSSYNGQKKNLYRGGTGSASFNHGSPGKNVSTSISPKKIGGFGTSNYGQQAQVLNRMQLIKLMQQVRYAVPRAGVKENANNNRFGSQNYGGPSNYLRRQNSQRKAQRHTFQGDSRLVRRSEDQTVFKTDGTHLNGREGLRGGSGGGVVDGLKKDEDSSSVVQLTDPRHIKNFGSNVVHVNVSCGNNDQDAQQKPASKETKNGRQAQQKQKEAKKGDEEDDAQTFVIQLDEEQTRALSLGKLTLGGVPIPKDLQNLNQQQIMALLNAVNMPSKKGGDSPAKQNQSKKGNTTTSESSTKQQKQSAGLQTQPQLLQKEKQQEQMIVSSTAQHQQQDSYALGGIYGHTGRGGVGGANRRVVDPQGQQKKILHSMNQTVKNNQQQYGQGQKQPQNNKCSYNDLEQLKLVQAGKPMATFHGYSNQINQQNQRQQQLLQNQKQTSLGGGVSGSFHKNDPHHLTTTPDQLQNPNHQVHLQQQSQQQAASMSGGTTSGGLSGGVKSAMFTHAPAKNQGSLAAYRDRALKSGTNRMISTGFPQTSTSSSNTAAKNGLSMPLMVDHDQNGSNNSHLINNNTSQSTGTTTTQSQSQSNQIYHLMKNSEQQGGNNGVVSRQHRQSNSYVQDNHNLHNHPYPYPHNPHSNHSNHLNMDNGQNGSGVGGQIKVNGLVSRQKRHTANKSQLQKAGLLADNSTTASSAINGSAIITKNYQQTSSMQHANNITHHHQLNGGQGGSQSQGQTTRNPSQVPISSQASNANDWGKLSLKQKMQQQSLKNAKMFIQNGAAMGGSSTSNYGGAGQQTALISGNITNNAAAAPGGITSMPSAPRKTLNSYDKQNSQILTRRLGRAGQTAASDGQQLPLPLHQPSILPLPPQEPAILDNGSSAQQFSASQQQAASNSQFTRKSQLHNSQPQIMAGMTPQQSSNANNQKQLNLTQTAGIGPQKLINNPNLSQSVQAQPFATPQQTRPGISQQSMTRLNSSKRIQMTQNSRPSDQMVMSNSIGMLQGQEPQNVSTSVPTNVATAAANSAQMKSGQRREFGNQLLQMVTPSHQQVHQHVTTSLKHPALISMSATGQPTTSNQQQMLPHHHEDIMKLQNQILTQKMTTTSFAQHQQPPPANHHLLQGQIMDEGGKMGTKSGKNSPQNTTNPNNILQSLNRYYQSFSSATQMPTNQTTHPHPAMLENSNIAAEQQVQIKSNQMTNHNKHQLQYNMVNKIRGAAGQDAQAAESRNSIQNGVKSSQNSQPHHPLNSKDSSQMMTMMQMQGGTTTSVKSNKHYKPSPLNNRQNLPQNNNPSPMIPPNHNQNQHHISSSLNNQPNNKQVSQQVNQIRQIGGVPQKIMMSQQQKQQPGFIHSAPVANNQISPTNKGVGGAALLTTTATTTNTHGSSQQAKLNNTRKEGGPCNTQQQYYSRVTDQSDSQLSSYNQRLGSSAKNSGATNPANNWAFVKNQPATKGPSSTLAQTALNSMNSSLGLGAGGQGLNARKLKNGKDPGEEIDTHA